MIITLGITGLFFILTWNMSMAYREVNSERKKILETISQSIPDRSRNIIIFTESDKSFYGLPDEAKILPFQAGPGKVLATYLYNQIYLPDIVYDSKILRALDSQGYYSDSWGSYGYFVNYNQLKEQVIKNKIDLKNIYSFKYTYESRGITNQTSKIRKQLEEEVSAQ